MTRDEIKQDIVDKLAGQEKGRAADTLSVKQKYEINIEIAEDILDELLAEGFFNEKKQIVRAQQYIFNHSRP